MKKRLPRSLLQNLSPPDEIREVKFDERAALLDSYFGDFRKGKKIKKSGSAFLQVWDNYIEFCKTLPLPLQKGLLSGVENLDVDYDELWTWNDPDNPGSRARLYWKENKVQASTVEEFYKADPVTHKKLSSPSYKIRNIYDREYILKELASK